MRKIEVSKSTRKRWAVIEEIGGRWLFLGIHCWSYEDSSEIGIKTFRTRKLARRAKNELGNLYNKPRVVPVEITIELRQ